MDYLRDDEKQQLNIQLAYDRIKRRAKKNWYIEIKVNRVYYYINGTDEEYEDTTANMVFTGDVLRRVGTDEDDGREYELSDGVYLYTFLELMNGEYRWITWMEAHVTKEEYLMVMEQKALGTLVHDTMCLYA